MMDAGDIALFACIGLGVWICQHEFRAVLHTRQRTAAVGLRDGDRVRLQRSMLARGFVATTALVMVGLLSILVLR